jgi:cellobiose epimerase
MWIGDNVRSYPPKSAALQTEGIRQPMTTNEIASELKQRMERELRENILPFWVKNVYDPSGGFYGAVSNELVIDNSVPRSLVLCSRLLWTYSAAYRLYGEPDYLKMARHAYEYLNSAFLDPEYGGMYWWLDGIGRPYNDRKQVYGQAFAIYALAEMHRATGEPEPLDLAKSLFGLVEKYGYDPLYGGYLEGCSRSWGSLSDMRLSDKEPFNSPKSMNTLLHVLEGYTNLLRVWPDDHLKRQQKNLVQVFLDHVVNPQTHFTNLFFDMEWNVLGDQISYGHDIECAWLLVEAAEGLDDPELLMRTQVIALQMASAVRSQGIAADGSIVAEGGPQGWTSTERHWWAQAEGVIGFYRAHQIGWLAGVEHDNFLTTAQRLWDFIENNIVDRRHGEWFKVLDRTGYPIYGQVKAGPWEDPYHQARACMEMIRRVG